MKIADLMPRTISMSYSTLGCKATMQPVSTRTSSPEDRTRSWMVPPAFTKASPSPWRRSMMKPSPPNRPTPNLFWNAMPIETPFAAHRKESFCAISSPPISGRWIGMIFPGYGEANASFSSRFRNTVMNSDSPVRRRLPAPTSASMKPFFPAEPSPKIVSIPIPSSMYIMPPASAMAASPGSSSTSTYCMSSPKIL